MNEKEQYNQPLAIIGIGCRFPGGASDPHTFWELLCQGRDAVTDIPPERWDIRKFYDPDPQKPGKTYVRQGGFLQEDIFKFDPLFFGISPREAQMLDPQQRLLLEIVWEAFEDAGLIAEKLSGSETGVFIGAFTLDHLMGMPLNRDVVNASSATGSTMTLLANRLSYVFDLHGPSIAIDTACSSSLVAVHYACQSLWSGECSLAIAGGVNLIWRPEYFIIISKGRFLSPSARCMAFDERADGYVRSEGAGVALLKPLANALQDGDPIYALIRATGCNQDGKTPGLASPNQRAQEHLMKRVYQQGEISPHNIQYLEAHGTGTKVGDPIEAHALHHVLSSGREPHNKCLVGSVKTNIGHLEAAAGIAGLIKTALCLKHKAIPPNLHFEYPNPAIPFEEMCLRVPTALEPWPPHNGPAYAGVNSFGYGGANAHVLLQEAPKGNAGILPAGEASGTLALHETSPLLFPLSARSEGALQELAWKYERFFRTEGDEISLKDFCYSCALRRSHHTHRAVIVAKTHEQVCAGLRALASGESHPGLACAQILPETERGVVFVYTGMGPQWWGMGQELLQTQPVFRECIEICDAIFRRYAGWSLLDTLTMPEQASRMKETQVAQPANFALQLALTALWKSWGIRPDAVVGHSVGEVTAACVSGALSLEDALLVSYHRSRLQQTCAGGGAMLAVELTEEASQELLQHYADVASIAAINSLSSVTLSGSASALQEIAALLAERNIFHRFLQVEVAYHSPHMDPLRQELLSVLSGLRPEAAKIPLYSTVTGGRMQGSELDAKYWWNNVRQPVHFAHALDAMLHDHYGIFVEVGPHPVLKHSIVEAFRTASVRAYHSHSLVHEKPEPATMLASLGYLHTLGLSVDWKAIVPDGGRYVPLPTYPWQREHFWLESQRSQEDRLGCPDHVLMNQDLRLPFPAWEVELNEYFFPYLQDHRIADHLIVPGALYVEAGLALHKKIFPQYGCVLEQLEFHKLLFADNKEGQILHLSFQPQTNRYTVYSRIRQEDSNWTCYASGKLMPVKAPILSPFDLTEIQQRCQNEIGVDTFYARLRRSKLHYGPYFQIFSQLLCGSQEALGRIQGHASLSNDSNRYWIHPTIFDAGFQLCAATINSLEAYPWVPVSIERVTFYESPANTCWAYSRILSQTEEMLRANVFILDDNGQIVVEVKNLCLQVVKLRKTSRDLLEQGLYELQWQQVEALEKDNSEFPGKRAPVSADSEHWLIFGDKGKTIEPLIELLDGQNISYTLISCGGAYRKNNNKHYCIRPGNRDDMGRMFADLHEKAFNAILYLWSLPENSDRALFDFEDSVRHCVTLQSLLQEFPHTDEKVAFGIVTRNCQRVQPGDRVEGVRMSPLWGLGRVVRIEYPRIQCMLLDLPHDEQVSHYSLLVKILQTKSQEVEIALRGDTFFVNRLTHISFESEAEQDRAYQSSTTEPVELIIAVPGSLDSLQFRASERRSPGPGEVEIKVHTAALNFKDILKARGGIPAAVIADTYFGESFGMECSGTVTAIGVEVEDVKLGDEVIATTNRGCFRSYITAPVTYMLPKPSTLKMEEAPVFGVFVTAYYALVYVARLQAGERVLIHNAAGGVGLAAVQVAQSLGAEIFATAGSKEKRAYLRSLGVSLAMDSRTLRFADEVMEFTGGAGVDVVLNALSGEALVKSFNLLGPYGRFVDIGKKDIAENAGLPMAAFNRNLSFSAVDIDRLFKERAPLARQVFWEVHQGFEQGRFHALPVTVFAASEATQAFRYMAHSKHIGKVMLAMADQEIMARPAPRKTQGIRADGAYLITGGTRGFGLEIARWFVSRGARYLALVSRSGAIADEARQAVAMMQKQGVQVLVEAVDVSDDTQVRQLFERVTTLLGPVRGIVHGAMILRDGLLNTLDPAGFREVMAPKILGAVHLHKYSMKQPLDFFVLLSSVSSLTGNAGQANYAAANAFLDSFAHYRRAQGLPATTINWGALEQVGVAARDEKVQRLLEQSGILGIATQEALHALEEFITHQPAQIAALRIDWDRWRQRYPAAADNPVFQYIISEKLAEGGSDERAAKQRDLRRKLEVLDAQAGLELLQRLLAEELAKVLQLPAEKLNAHQNIMEMGVDSLTAVEFTQTLQRELGLEVSAMDFMGGLSLAQMAGRVSENLRPDHERVEAGQPGEDPFLEVRRDAALDPGIRPLAATAYQTTLTGILLTGATGLLGAHLLHDLYALTPARIYCLVRASDGAAARMRLDQQLAEYFADFRADDRITALVGDLTRPRFGLSVEDFTRLSADIDTVYHCGAQVNHLAPYESLRASNVLGLIEILKLACADTPKQVHAISSLVAAVEQDEEGYRLDEDWLSGDPPEFLKGYGYAQTKWAAERLLAQAQERGLQVRIYRPGFIGGRSDSGVWLAERDHLLLMLRGCLQMGYAPDSNAPLDLLPVDFLSELIVKMSLCEEAPGNVFNCSHPGPATWNEVIAWLKDLGHELTVVAAEEWRERSLRRIEAENVLYPLLPFYLDQAEGAWQTRFFSSVNALSIERGNTRRMLERLKMEYPATDAQLWQRYVRRFC